MHPDEHIVFKALIRHIHDLHAISHLMQETGGRGAVQAIQIRGSGSGSDNWTPMQNVWGAEWVSETAWGCTFTLGRISIHCCYLRVSLPDCLCTLPQESSSQPAGSISFRILPDQGGEVINGPRAST